MTFKVHYFLYSMLVFFQFIPKISIHDSFSFVHVVFFLYTCGFTCTFPPTKQNVGLINVKIYEMPRNQQNLRKPIFPLIGDIYLIFYVIWNMCVCYDVVWIQLLKDVCWASSSAIKYKHVTSSVHSPHVLGRSRRDFFFLIIDMFQIQHGKIKKILVATGT